MLRTPSSPTPPPSLRGVDHQLTRREVEVVRLVVEGRTNPEIAALLVISPRTVQSHVAAAMRKLDARTRTQLAVAALRTRVVPLVPVGSRGPLASSVPAA